jgi:peptidoglycan hydrolase CwlO-like protein
MTANDWAGLVLAFASITGSLAVAVRFLVKHYLAELKPNGGSSIKDRVGEIEKKIDKLENQVDEIYALLVAKKKR